MKNVSTAEVKQLSPKTVSIKDTFNVNVEPGKVIPILPALNNPHVPSISDGYKFRLNELRHILSFLTKPGEDAMCVTGPTGSGKSSFVKQVCGRLNWPVINITCHGRMEYYDLVGRTVLRDGNMSWVDGPLTMAMRHGYVLLLNESDCMDPGELLGLNGVLEGDPLILEQHDNEIVKPHKNFRVIITGNSAGTGDDSGLYSGVLQQNLAFMDRFRVLNIGYMSEDEEMDVLEEAVGKIPAEMRRKMIKVAADVRKQFLGDENNSPQISITMSTRTLVRWALLTLTLSKSVETPYLEALNVALLNRAAPVEKEAIRTIARTHMG